MMFLNYSIAQIYSTGWNIWHVQFMVIIGISTRNLENKSKGQRLIRIGPQFLDGLFLLGFLWAAKLKLWAVLQYPVLP
jgi:hypothetical protein